MSPEPATPTTAPARTFRQVTLPSLGAPDGARAAAVAQEHDRARAAGYAAGWAAGSRVAAEAAERQQRAVAEEAARARAEQAAFVAEGLAALERAVVAAAGRTAPVVEAASTEVVEAAVALAEAILARELSDGPTSARSVLDRVRALPSDVEVHTLRVSTADHAAVLALLADTGATLPDGVALVADPSLAPGDVVAEHPDGYVDGRVRSALDRARRALEEVA